MGKFFVVRSAELGVRSVAAAVDFEEMSPSAKESPATGLLNVTFALAARRKSAAHAASRFQIASYRDWLLAKTISCSKTPKVGQPATRYSNFDEAA
jgi:hypothetical protein